MVTARQRVFNSVFPTVGKVSAPTPQATPVLGSAPFGGATSFDESRPSEDAATRRIRWERAWHNVTTVLALPQTRISVPEDPRFDFVKPGVRDHGLPKDDVALLLHGPSANQPPDRLSKNSIVEWYSQDIARHFLSVELPLLLAYIKKDGEDIVGMLYWLQQLQNIYLDPFVHGIMPQLGSPGGELAFADLKSSYHAIVGGSLAKSPISKLWIDAVEERTRKVIFHADPPRENGDIMDIDLDPQWATRRQAFSIMERLETVGLGGASAQRHLAELADRILVDYVKTTYASRWSSPSTAPGDIKDWIEKNFAPFIYHQLLLPLLKNLNLTETLKGQIGRSAVAAWQERAISELGELRIRELFDIVVAWDSDSLGAIEDLKQYITTTASRAHLVYNFSEVINQRLLQPGASTTQILQVYICIIRAFAVLDPRGVLLERIARQIRSYLRHRDDTVKIIVGGLLADSVDDTSSPDALVELAAELNRINEVSAEDDSVDDWDDMSWMPDPVDAGPDYKKGGATDVIGTLISLFESKDTFVREFQNILASRLLQLSHTYDKEIRVLELLKLRFGEAPLQACEVMLKDILDSRRTDVWIKNARKIEETDQQNAFSVKILSRLFWPSLNTETFTVPKPITAISTSYSKGFEQYKSSRKLTWLPAVGQVTVELHLTDRVVKEQVTPWQASVVYAFDGDEIDTLDGEPVTRTVVDLEDALEMDEDLVRNALNFWVGKMVLTCPASDTYTVLETLPASDPTSCDGQDATTTKSNTLVAAAASASAAAASASLASAVRSEADVMEEKMAVFWMFIEGMLTNQGAMPLGQIVMMLKFAVPGGFPFSDGELKEFLGHKIEQGGLEIAGGKYKLRK